jgi:hypothetical protein
VKFANTLMAGPTPELGLNLDMLDADRLDVIAAQVTERDAAYLRDLAQRVRLEVREVLELRANQK